MGDGAEQAAGDKPHLEQASAAKGTSRKPSRIPFEHDTNESAVHKFVKPDRKRLTSAAGLQTPRDRARCQSLVVEKGGRRREVCKVATNENLEVGLQI